jgi:hypothetical protein
MRQSMLQVVATLKGDSASHRQRPSVGSGFKSPSEGSMDKIRVYSNTGILE